MRKQPLHQHVPNHELQILADLHVIDSDMDRNICQGFGLTARIAKDGEALHP